MQLARRDWRGEMAKYFVNSKSNSDGFHVIHDMDKCRFLPKTKHQIPLNATGSLDSVMEEAQTKYRKSRFCRRCRITD